MSRENDACEPRAERAVPRALVSRNPLEWLRVFGPGAIIASLTIGTGELIFSSRGGVIFGYSILFLFSLICLLKWTLAYSAARHMVLSGVHPFERWMEMPFGPRGWLTVLFSLLATAFIPVWMSFHASVLGDFLAWLTDTKQYLSGATIHVWGVGLVLAVIGMSLAGGYSALEKVQIAIVSCMLAAVVVTLVMFKPDWFEFLRGFVLPERFAYPEWLRTSTHPLAQKIVERPVWSELALYAGVIGGASYDYLAYTSYIRDKQWGYALPQGHAVASSVSGDGESAAVPPELDEITLRQWLRAPLIDCTLSFLVVLIFSAVFVASGKLVLGPEHKIPGDGAFLEYQAQFVTQIHPWLKPIYVVAAFLTMFGTLYGTLEIAPTVLREAVFAIVPGRLNAGAMLRVRRLAIAWTGGVALAVLVSSFLYQLRMGTDKLPGLTPVLEPVNLFTGVFGCGLICLLNAWMDGWLPARRRMPAALTTLNVLGGFAFIAAAIRGYWVYGGWWAMLILASILGVGIAVAWLGQRLWNDD